ncbi:MAG TPA: AAA family ATPase [Kofleriaceae bacterium]|jgi:predicted ATPase|nr:AAA family ATPase [Kofleriaceae bacterium]
MRVAFAGTHRTGKTTLLEAVHARLPGYQHVEEPYRWLEDEGHEFSDPPSAEDFERQLRRSIDSIAESGARTLFDRCPLDLVAYLQAIDEDFAVDDWIDDLRAGMAVLDLVVLLSIETPDRIALPSHEDRRLRRRVDGLLQTLLLDDPCGFGTEVLEVAGTLDHRVTQVMRALAGRAG